MAVVRSLLLFVFLAFLFPGCGEDCDCSSLPGILIEVVDIEPSGSVEVCYDQQCGEVDLRDVDSDTADEAYVPFDDLGDLEQDIDARTTVEVAIRDASGNDVRAETVTLVSSENCCGVYWTAAL